MNRIRIKYSKEGKAKYISHLDLTAIMQRAFIRAGINLKYSEGFNPHPYISVALPLSVGCESMCELLDVDISADSIPNIEIISLPEGIVIKEIYKPNRKFNDIDWVKVDGTVHYIELNDSNITEKINNCFNQKSIMISKKTKRGIKELDIAPYVKNFNVESDNKLKFTALISAQNPAVNAADLEKVFFDDIKPEYIDLKRIELYDSNMILFK